MKKKRRDKVYGEERPPLTIFQFGHLFLFSRGALLLATSPNKKDLKPGPNEICPCKKNRNAGKLLKFKKCCGRE